MGTVGAVVHAIPKVLDLYGFYGWNWVGASYFPGGGLNWNMLRGKFGTLRSGVQYSNIVKTAYYGLGGTPSAAENLVMFNFRYLPFE